VKEENNIMNVRAHMSFPKVISVPCYGVFYMRLCQFSLRRRKREQRKKTIYGYNSACLGSIACFEGVIIIIFMMEGGRNAENSGENFC
jgi:hypothetical protein